MKKKEKEIHTQWFTTLKHCPYANVGVFYPVLSLSVNFPLHVNNPFYSIESGTQQMLLNTLHFHYYLNISWKSNGIVHYSLCHKSQGNNSIYTLSFKSQKPNT